MKRTPTELNALSLADFTALLGGVYEHSPWIAERAARHRPFGSLAELQEAMGKVVETAADGAQLALIQAHPDLAGKLAQLGQLTPESAREQAAAGLDAMSPEELQRMAAGNEAYRAKFGFPFIICARRHTKNAILQAMTTRLQHDPATERAAALQEIHHIAQLRMEDILCQEN